VDGLIEIDGVQLAYGRSGDGPPLVLLHGGSARRELWDEFTPLLEDANRVYTPDLPGHGRSGRTPGRYDLETVAGVVARFIREVAGGPAAVYGHSYGGHVALVLAARHRDVVELAIAGDAPLSRGAVCSVIDSSRDRLEAWRAPSATASSWKAPERVAELIRGFLRRPRLSEP
jgi:magnesium chelatase accessory protein